MRTSPDRNIVSPFRVCCIQNRIELVHVPHRHWGEDEILALCNTCSCAGARSQLIAHLRVVAIVAVYNEADILGQVLEHLHEHGISFVILDDGSQDGSIEIIQNFEGKGLLDHEIVRHSVFRRQEGLDSLVEMAARHSPDWILANDADEFLEPREPGQTLYDAIAREDQLGYNVIQFDNFEFHLTERDCGTELDIRKKLQFYTWVDDYHYKAWKYYPGARCGGGGHYPVFPSGVRAKVSPRKLVLRHYPFRSPQQAMRKVFKERLPRYASEARARGWHLHYDHFKEDPRFFVLDSKLLSEYGATGGWELTKRFDWGSDWKSPTQEELFSQSLLLRMWRRYLRLLHNAFEGQLFTWLSAIVRKGNRQ